MRHVLSVQILSEHACFVYDKESRFPAPKWMAAALDGIKIKALSAENAEGAEFYRLGGFDYQFTLSSRPE